MPRPTAIDRTQDHRDDDQFTLSCLQTILNSLQFHRYDPAIFGILMCSIIIRNFNVSTRDKTNNFGYFGCQQFYKRHDLIILDIFFEDHQHQSRGTFRFCMENIISFHSVQSTTALIVIVILNMVYGDKDIWRKRLVPANIVADRKKISV